MQRLLRWPFLRQTIIEKVEHGMTAWAFYHESRAVNCCCTSFCARFVHAGKIEGLVVHIRLPVQKDAMDTCGGIYLIACHTNGGQIGKRHREVNVYIGQRFESLTTGNTGNQP